MKMGNSSSNKKQRGERVQVHQTIVQRSSDTPVCTPPSTSSLTTGQTTTMISMTSATTTTTSATTTTTNDPAELSSLPCPPPPVCNEQEKNSQPLTMPVNLLPPVSTGSKIDRNAYQTSSAPCGPLFLATFPFDTNDLLNPRRSSQEVIVASAIAENAPDSQRDVLAIPNHSDTNDNNQQTNPIAVLTAPPIGLHFGVNEIDEDYQYDYVEPLQINSADATESPVAEYCHNGPVAEECHNGSSWDPLGPSPQECDSEYVAPDRPFCPDAEVSGEYMPLSKPDVTIDKLNFLHFQRLLSLDHCAPNAKNYYDLASCCFDKDVCDDLNRCYAGGGDPARRFLENLVTRDEFGVEGLMNRCKQIKRVDIHNYLNALIQDQIVTPSTSIEDLLSLRNPAVKDRLARYLDYKTHSIHCWKQLATTYNYTVAEIEVIGATIRENNSYSPTETLIRKIQIESPDLPISLFIKKLEQIGRADLVKEMRAIVTEIEDGET